MGTTANGPRPLPLAKKLPLPCSRLAPRSCSCSSKLQHTQREYFKQIVYNYIVLDRIPSCILKGLGTFRHSLSNVQFHFTLKITEACFQTLISFDWCYCQV